MARYSPFTFSCFEKKKYTFFTEFLFIFEAACVVESV